ncbi:MAG: PQQ-dependent sugar dehydrogenase, partial [Ilumatobacteraceae bacterium]
MTHHTTATSRRLRRAVAALTGVATLATPTFAAAAPDHDAASSPSSGATEAGARRAPNLRVNTVLSGLDHPWGVAFTPNGSMLVTERNRGRVMLRTPRGNVRTLVGNVPNLWVSGETGLMGIEVDPRFRANRRFYTCHGFRDGSTTDVRVVAWRANSSLTSAQAVDNLVTGIQVSSGRHGGCRLRFGGKGALFIGTGDAAITGSARDRTSLAG